MVEESAAVVAAVPAVFEVDAHQRVASALINQGMALVRLGRRDEAIKCLGRASREFGETLDAGSVIDLAAELQQVAQGPYGPVIPSKLQYCSVGSVIGWMERSKLTCAPSEWRQERILGTSRR
jgi:hypothetical protein